MKRFQHKIVLLWEREGKCEAFLVQNCSVTRYRTEEKLFWEENCSPMGKTTEVRSVFGKKLFSYG